MRLEPQCCASSSVSSRLLPLISLGARRPGNPPPHLASSIRILVLRKTNIQSAPRILAVASWVEGSRRIRQQTWAVSLPTSRAPDLSVIFSRLHCVWLGSEYVPYLICRCRAVQRKSGFRSAPAADTSRRGPISLAHRIRPENVAVDRLRPNKSPPACPKLCCGRLIVGVTSRSLLYVAS